jgi:hypothetical protein
MRTALLPFLVFALLPLVGRAGGSFYFTDLKDLLAQQPTLARFLTEHFDISEVGTAPRISTGANKHLSGIRIAPFELEAKPKSAPGDFSFVLIIDAETTYLDSSGRAVTLPKATKIRQRFTGLRVLPKRATAKRQ